VSSLKAVTLDKREREENKGLKSGDESLGDKKEE
jgi:hypothetical protein